MITRLALICLFCLFSRSLIGQGLGLAMDNGFLKINITGSLSLDYLTSETFQELDWQPGYAYYLDGSAREFTGLKYKPAEDAMWVNTGETVIPLFPGVINGVSMETGESVKHIFVKVPLQTPVFMEVLSAGKVHLMLHRVLGDREKEEIVGTKTLVFDYREPSIDFSEKTYVWTPQGGVERIKLSKKTVLAIMSDYTSEVEMYIDDNNLRIKNISDAMKVFDYYNRISSSEEN